VREGRNATGLPELAGPPKSRTQRRVSQRCPPRDRKGQVRSVRRRVHVMPIRLRCPAPGGRPVSVSVRVGPGRSPQRLPGMTTPGQMLSSTIPLAGRSERSRLSDGSDFLPYPNEGSSDQNKSAFVGLGRPPRTMAGAAQNEGARRLRIRYSPQSEEEQGVTSALRCHPCWVGQKGFEGFMPLTRWSEGVPHTGDRRGSGYSIRASTVAAGRATP
jgi:hypothetical protein